MSEMLAEVVSEHNYVGRSMAQAPHCSCGLWMLGSPALTHHHHLATAVLAWVEARLAGARDEVVEAIDDTYTWSEGEWSSSASQGAHVALAVVREALGVEVGS